MLTTIAIPIWQVMLDDSHSSNSPIVTNIPPISSKTIIRILTLYRLKMSERYVNTITPANCNDSTT